MNINPYEATFVNDAEQNGVAQFSNYFSFEAAIYRFSLLFVIGTVGGIVLAVATKAGLWNSVRELAEPGGLRMLSITIPFACLASIVYPMTERNLRQMIVRLMAGVSMGASFFMLVLHADATIGDILGINMHTNSVGVFLFPFAMYLIAISISMFIEYIIRLAVFRKPTD